MMNINNSWMKTPGMLMLWTSKITTLERKHVSLCLCSSSKIYFFQVWMNNIFYMMLTVNVMLQRPHALRMFFRFLLLEFLLWKMSWRKLALWNSLFMIWKRWASSMWLSFFILLASFFVFDRGVHRLGLVGFGLTRYPTRWSIHGLDSTLNPHLHSQIRTN